MGWPAESCAKEEDQSYEEATQADGRQGIEGCHSIEQVQFLRKSEESTYSMSALRAEYVSYPMKDLDEC